MFESILNVLALSWQTGTPSGKNVTHIQSVRSLLVIVVGLMDCGSGIASGDMK